MLSFDFQTARVLNLFGGKFTQSQVDSIQAIVKEANHLLLQDKRHLAYILATAYHECYNPKKPETRLTPMSEFGGEDYLKGKPYYPYYGRGFSQLTWLANYKKEAKRMELDLVNHPEIMLLLPVAANSHVWCMMKGVYTGKKLSDYITGNKKDYRNARRIVNGTDKAELIAGYAEQFEKCVK